MNKKVSVRVFSSLLLNSVDEYKLCRSLGPGFPIPVEISPFCPQHTIRTIAAIPSFTGCDPVLRMGSSSNNKVDGDGIAITYYGNYIADLYFKEILRMCHKWRMI